MIFQATSSISAHSRSARFFDMLRAFWLARASDGLPARSNRDCPALLLLGQSGLMIENVASLLVIGHHRVAGASLSESGNRPVNARISDGKELVGNSLDLVDTPCS